MTPEEADTHNRKVYTRHRLQAMSTQHDMTTRSIWAMLKRGCPHATCPLAKKPWKGNATGEPCTSPACQDALKHVMVEGIVAGWLALVGRTQDGRKVYRRRNIT